MIITIYTGKHFSQLLLIHKTNKFFSPDRLFSFKKSFCKTEGNYIFQIKHKCISIILPEQNTEKDFLIIRKYIERIFHKRTIAVSSKNILPFLRDIKDVTIYEYTY